MTSDKDDEQPCCPRNPWCLGCFVCDPIVRAFLNNTRQPQTDAVEIERLRIEAEAQYDRGYYDGCTHPIVQTDALAPVGTKGKYIHEGFVLACRVTAHIEGWLEVEFKGDNSPAVIRPSRFAALKETT